MTDTANPTIEPAAALALLRAGLRPGQQRLADWTGGPLAVSAVPGAGKSHSLAIAAALAIARHQLHARRQLLVVTFARAAAAAIKQKIRHLLRELHQPQTSFAVYTLHGLALHIASRHPELSGLALNTVNVISPSQSHHCLRTAVEQWIVSHPDAYRDLLRGQTPDSEETERLRRQSVLRTEILPELAHTAIHEAKSSGFLPAEVRDLAELAPAEGEILAIAAGLYAQYQQVMQSRSFIDYDDMILAALRVLDYPPIRQLWQEQFFAVFEDEAQDSTPLQETLLRLLASDAKNPTAPPNFVRVGDPNQAINSTFTPADPIYFNAFCTACQAQGRLATMNQAGRSSRPIFQAANALLHWVNDQAAADTLAPPTDLSLPFRRQDIQPVAAADPQPDANPPPSGVGVEIHRPADVYQTVQQIAQRLRALLSDNPKASAAILVRENRQARFVADQLVHLPRESDIQLYEVGALSRHSQIPAEILKLLQFIDRPHSPDRLQDALEVLVHRQRIGTQDLSALATAPEQFLYPTPLAPDAKPIVATARRLCRSLLRARVELPPYQLIAFLGLALQYDGSELATVQKLAERASQQTLGGHSLKSLLEALGEIVASERFEGVEEESESQYVQPGQVTIITMHKAKGLDWDYVFLPFLHQDSIPGEAWVPTGSRFLGNFTLAAVARAQLRTAARDRHLHHHLPDTLPTPQAAWQQASMLKQAEEYRLLYVAMTRAKRLLWLSAAENGPFRWNIFSGQSAQTLQPKMMARVITALQQQI
ncbi:MAG: ATP-dependent helicase [Spirulinaceae cyanobacterium SM2_1_0]|nr:ATP-dependent helicase [Spirulinaceae cyanobacterium SM2_1_0]